MPEYKRNANRSTIFIHVSACVLFLVAMPSMLTSSQTLMLFDLDQTQVLYLASTNAQVAAALEALTIAGYTLLYQRLPQNSPEVYSDLHRKWRVIVAAVLVSANWSIIMSVLGILVSSNSDGNEFLLKFVINSGPASLIILLVFISELILKVINPNALKQESERQIKLLNKQIDADSDRHGWQKGVPKAISNTDEMDKFKDKYDKFAELLSKKAGYWPDYKQSDSTALRNAIQALHLKGMIDSNIATNMNKLVAYQNYLEYAPESPVNPAFESLLETGIKTLETLPYKVKKSPQFSKELQKLDSKMHRSVQNAMNILTKDPYSKNLIQTKLHRLIDGNWVYRIGPTLRIAYQIENNTIIFIELFRTHENIAMR